MLLFFRRDDDLAAAIDRHTALAAERDQLLAAGPAQPRPQRSGLVVKARMNNAAVVPGLMARDRGFLLDHRDPRARPAPQDLPRGCEPNDPASNHDHIPRHRHRAADEPIQDAMSSNTKSGMCPPR